MLAWFKKNKFETIFIISLILLTAFLRLYRIDEYMTFLGDEGRDALVVKKILVNYDFPLLGAPTSVGNMYNGPLYYYMMASAMAVWWMNPVAAAAMVALVGTAAVALVYYLARSWFGKVAAMISAVLYSLSPVNIIYSHSSWNPNPAPFFALLGILGLYKSRTTKNYLWLILTGISIAFAIQMHLLALILIPIYATVWIYDLWAKYKQSFFPYKFENKNKAPYKNFWTGFALALVAFLILMSPLAIFDFKYNFQNYRALTTFFLGDRATTVNLNPFNSLERVGPLYYDNLVNRYIAADNFYLMIIVSVLCLLPLASFAWNLMKRKKFIWPFFALNVWLLGGILGLALYKQNVYDHYSSFLNPALFLLFGANVNLINSINSKKVGQSLRGAFVLLVLVIIIMNLQISPLLKEPNRQLQRSQEVAKFVIKEAGGKPYNFALIANGNYDAAYQFYLDQYGVKPAQLPFEKTDQLIVVCEDEVCNPIGHQKYEIAAFGWALIEWQKETNGVKVYKLIHNPEEEMQNPQ